MTLTMKAQIIHNIIKQKLIEHQVYGVCLHVGILFSQTLKKRNIEHRIVFGYLNMDKIHSTCHIWIEVDGKIYDPTIESFPIIHNRLPSQIHEYSKLPLYELIDEDTNEEKETKSKLIEYFNLFIYKPECIWQVLLNLKGVSNNIKMFVRDTQSIL